MSFRDSMTHVASGDEINADTRLIEGYDDPSEHPDSHFDTLRSTDHLCEVNLLLHGAGAPTMNEAELRLQSLAFTAGRSAKECAREIMDDRRRLNGPDGVAA